MPLVEKKNIFDLIQGWGFDIATASHYQFEENVVKWNESEGVSIADFSLDTIPFQMRLYEHRKAHCQFKLSVFLDGGWHNYLHIKNSNYPSPGERFPSAKLVGGIYHELLKTIVPNCSSIYEICENEIELENSLFMNIIENLYRTVRLAGFKKEVVTGVGSMLAFINGATTTEARYVIATEAVPEGWSLGRGKLKKRK